MQPQNNYDPSEALFNKPQFGSDPKRQVSTYHPLTHNQTRQFNDTPPAGYVKRLMTLRNTHTE